MEKCKKCGSHNIIMVECAPGSPEHYDGVSEIDCKDCGVRIGRWTGDELKDGELEPRNGYKKK